MSLFNSFYLRQFCLPFLSFYRFVSGIVEIHTRIRCPFVSSSFFSFGQPFTSSPAPLTVQVPTFLSVLPPFIPMSRLCQPSSSSTETLPASTSTKTKETNNTNFLYIIFLLYKEIANYEFCLDHLLNYQPDRRSKIQKLCSWRLACLHRAPIGSHIDYAAIV